jgi:hypothetical protein
MKNEITRMDMHNALYALKYSNIQLKHMNNLIKALTTAPFDMAQFEANEKLIEKFEAILYPKQTTPIEHLTMEGMKRLFNKYLEKINHLTFGVTDSVQMDVRIKEWEAQINRFPQTCQVSLLDMAAELQGANDAAADKANQNFHTTKN